MNQNSIFVLVPQLVSGFAMVLLLAGIPVQAVKADTTDATSLRISARSIRLDASSRRVVYTGNVRLYYKSLYIKGSKAVAENNGAGRNNVKITGDPVKASFRDDQGNPVDLSSLSLEYRADEKTLIARGDVKINSSQGTLQGQQMKYDMSHDQFSISGNKKSPRVDAVINLKNTSSK